MPTAQEMLLQLKIDDFEVLKNDLLHAIEKIRYIPLKAKIRNELDLINLTTSIGKLDLAVLACVLNDMQVFQNKILMRNSTLDANEYLKSVISYYTFTRLFNDVDVIDDAEALLLDNPIGQEPTTIGQIKEFATILAMRAKAAADGVLEVVSTDPNCVAAFTLITEKPKQAARALQGAAAWVSRQASSVTDELDQAAFRAVHGLLFPPPEPPARRAQPQNTRQSSEQPPLP